MTRIIIQRIQVNSGTSFDEKLFSPKIVCARGDVPLVNCAARVNPTSRSFVDLSAVKGKHYYYRIRAINDANNEVSPWRGTAMNGTVMIFSDLNRIQIQTENRCNASSVRVTWRIADNVAGNIWLERSVNQGEFTVLPIDRLKTEYVDTEVHWGQALQYRLVTFMAGENQIIASTNAVTPFVETTIEPPGNLKSFLATSSSVELSWKRGTKSEEGYRVLRSEDDGEFRSVAQLPAGVTYFSDTGLKPSTDYGYKIVAFCGDEITATSNVSDSIKTLPKPRAKTGDVLGSSGLMGKMISLPQGESTYVGVALSWNDNADNESGYEVQRKLQQGQFETLSSLGENIQTYIDNTAVFKNQYEYRIVTLGGESPAVSRHLTVKTNPIDLDRSVLCQLLESEPDIHPQSILGRHFERGKTAAAAEPSTPVTGYVGTPNARFRGETRKTKIFYMTDFSSLYKSFESGDYGRFKSASKELTNKIGNAILIIPEGDYYLDKSMPHGTSENLDIEFDNLAHLRIYGCGQVKVSVKGDIFQWEKPSACSASSTVVVQPPMPSKCLAANPVSATADDDDDEEPEVLAELPSALVCNPPTGKILAEPIIPFSFSNVEDLELSGIELSGNVHQMGRDKALEFVENRGIGVKTRFCVDCVFRDLEVHHFALDGIYIGGGLGVSNAPGRLADENIRLHHIRAHHNTRLGITVVQAEHVWLSNSDMFDTGKTESSEFAPLSPAVGLDIEPNSFTQNRYDIEQRLNGERDAKAIDLLCKEWKVFSKTKVNKVTSDIWIENIRSENNLGRAFQASLGSKKPTQWPVAKTKDLTIKYSRFVHNTPVHKITDGFTGFGFAVENGTLESSFVDLGVHDLLVSNGTGDGRFANRNDALISTNLIANEIHTAGTAIGAHYGRHPLSIDSNLIVSQCNSERAPVVLTSNMSPQIIKRDTRMTFFAAPGNDDVFNGISVKDIKEKLPKTTFRTLAEDLARTQYYAEIDVRVAAQTAADIFYTGSTGLKKEFKNNTVILCPKTYPDNTALNLGYTESRNNIFQFQSVNDAGREYRIVYDAATRVTNDVFRSCSILVNGNSKNACVLNSSGQYEYSSPR